MKKNRGPNRRQFLSAGGSMLAAFSATTPKSGQKPSARKGSRIDCQSHLFAPELLSLMEKRQESPRAYRQGDDLYVVVGDWVRRVLPKHLDVAAKIVDMDLSGIQMTALSINDPGPELFGKEGAAVARIANDFVAEVARQHPSRFFGLMVLPLQDMEAALLELDRCANRLGMKGILLYSNLAGKFPDLPEFRPLFERAEALGLPVLLHPAFPTTYEATKGYNMAAGLGLMFDTTIALNRIILAGILDQYPQLKLVCPHVGGALPYLIGRVDHQTMILKRGADQIKIKKPPSEYLRHIYLDTVSPLAMAIRYGYDFVGPDRLLFASDHPWVNPALIAGNVESLNLTAEAEEKIFSANAKRLFRL